MKHVDEMQNDIDALVEFRNNLFTRNSYKRIDGVMWELGVSGNGVFQIRKDREIHSQQNQPYAIMQEWYNIS